MAWRVWRPSVRARLFGIATAGALLTAVVGGVGLNSHARLDTANRQEVRAVTMQALTLQLLSLQHKVRAQVWFACAVGAGRQDEVAAEFAGAEADLRDALVRFVAASERSERAVASSGIVAGEFALLAHGAQVISSSRTGDAAALAKAGAGFEDESDALEAQVVRLAEDFDRDRAAEFATAQRVERTGAFALVAAAIAAAALVVGLSALLARAILRGLRHVADIAAQIGHGDLHARCVVRGDDEIAAVAVAVNETADALGDTMQRLTADAQRDAFNSHVGEAFDMAETEAETYGVIGRALRELDPRHPAELLIADSSDAHLIRRAVSDGADPDGCPVGSPFGCVAVRRAQPLVFDDSEAIHACPKLRGRPSGPLSAVCVPVTFMGQPLGVVHSTGEAGHRADPGRVEGLVAVAAQSGNRVGTLRSFEQAQLQAATDGLTGLLNRRAFESHARDVLRAGTPTAVVVADLDHFKRLNDTHGHEAGDRALRLFGRVVRGALRDTDVAGRIGGEEFGIVLHNVTESEAAAILDRLRTMIGDLATGDAPPFTASFGLCHTDTAGHVLDELLRTADAALYRAKRSGRDRVVLSTDAGPSAAASTADLAGRLRDVADAATSAASDQARPG